MHLDVVCYGAATSSFLEQAADSAQDQEAHVNSPRECVINTGHASALRKYALSTKN